MSDKIQTQEEEEEENNVTDDEAKQLNDVIKEMRDAMTLTKTLDPKEFALIFYLGIKTASFGISLSNQWDYGMYYLEMLGNQEVITEYKKLIDEDKNDDEEEDKNDDEEEDKNDDDEE